MSNDESGRGGVGEYLKTHGVAIVLTVVVIALVIQNIIMIKAPAKLGLLFTTIELPSWLFLTVAFLAGAVAGWFFRRNRSGRK